MPTATASPTAPPVEISDELWREYRRLRAVHPRPGVAAGFALTATGFTKSDTRNRLSRALTEREQARGLAASRAELEADAAAEAAALDENAAAPPEPGSAQAIRADALRMVAELEAARARLSPEALSDPDVRAEIDSIDGQLAQARATAQLVDDAERENARREREAIEVAEREAREQAAEEARGLQPAIRKAAQRVDTAAGVFAESVAAFRELRDQQAAALARTGVRGRQYRPGLVAGALQVALRARGVAVEGVEGHAHAQPLAAAEPTEGV